MRFPTGPARPPWLATWTRDLGILLAVVLTLQSITILNMVASPLLRNRPLASILHDGLLGIIPATLAQILVLPAVIALVETGTRPGLARWKAPLIYLAGAAACITALVFVDRAVSQVMVAHGLIKSRPPGPFFQNFFFFPRFLSRVPTFLMVLLIKYKVSDSRGLAERSAQAAQLENQLAQAKLESLRAQIQPHFLFNALSLIYSRINPEDQAARHMIQLLSRFLRRAVATSYTQAMTLREELDFMAPFLEIQRMRFEGRLVLEEILEPGCERRLVPHFLLQPLLENAVKYGVGGSLRPVTVRIRAWEAEGFLCLAVEDDGEGRCTTGLDEPGAGAGQALTRMRLTQQFGDPDLFQAGPLPEGGYASRVRIPLAATQAGDTPCAS